MKLWVSVTDDNGELLDRFPIITWDEYERMSEPEAASYEIPSNFGSLERRLLEELKRAEKRSK